MIHELVAIRNDVFACTRSCAGVACSPDTGARPRGPLIDTRGEVDAIGALVVGLNPGRAGDEEREVLRRESYATDWEPWSHQHLSEKNLYLERLRRFVRAIGVNGPIIWSNVAKCECLPDQRGLPLLTQRDCAHRFLIRELSVVPATWVAIAAGRDAYNALAFLALNHVVLGIPHPTGAYPVYSRLWNSDKTLHPHVAEAVAKIIANGQSTSAWLGKI